METESDVSSENSGDEFDSKLPNKKKLPKSSGGLTALATCGIEFASAIIVAVLFGEWLDKYFNKSPLFLVIFFLLGSLAGYFNVLRFINSNENRKF
ncbi:MAG: AtpZ/AtpI family protein [Holosporaceae bacterium]|jgi:F0F1-type ATP synthase assembly protein I|nr:AtpZ/AtpI family protein [Holosporaceae bacterium]